VPAASVAIDIAAVARFGAVVVSGRAEPAGKTLRAVITVCPTGPVVSKNVTLPVGGTLTEDEVTVAVRVTVVP
jgi:hypothetical protein